MMMKMDSTMHVIENEEHAVVCGGEGPGTESSRSEKFKLQGNDTEKPGKCEQKQGKMMGIILIKLKKIELGGVKGVVSTLQVENLKLSTVNTAVYEWIGYS